MKPDDLLARSLAELSAPELDPAFASRVGARAMAMLAPPIERPAVRNTLAAVLVPALLLSAAVVRLVEAVEVDTQISARGVR
jgi:hypothetical protein